MPEFSYTEMLPTGAGRHPVPAADRRTGSAWSGVRPGIPADRAGRADAAHRRRHARHRAPAAARRTCGSCARSWMTRRRQRNDRFVACDLLKNACIAAGGVLPMCQDTGTAIVMGKRGQQVLTDGRDEEHIARGVYDAYTKLNLRYSQLAPLTMWDERNTGSNLPAQIELYATGRRRVQVPVHGQGRRLGQQVLPLPGDQGGAEPARMAGVPGGEDPLAGHRRVPALPPGHRGRRHQRRVRAEDRQVRLGQVPRHAADRRARSAAHGFRDTELEQQVLEITRKVRHRRAVRRQVLLPRRPGDQAAPARRLLPGGDRGVLLGGPAGPRQDHRGRRLPRAARNRPRAVSARHRPRPNWTTTSSGSTCPADGRDPRRAVPVPDQDPAGAVRPDGGRPRHRARQDRRTAGRRPADARLPARPRRLLRRARPRPRRVTRPGRSGRPRPAGWTPTWTSSRRPAARW